MDARLPNLQLLLAGYFHQDFELEPGDPENALRRFMAEEQPATISDCADEIGALFAAHPDERTLARPALDLGCYYRPEADGHTTRSWLQHVARELREHSSR